MESNATAGVVLHALGGLAAGSFYVPLSRVKTWSWESSWLVMGVAAWLIAPWFVAWLTIPDLLSVLSESWNSLNGAWIAAVGFGLLWGVGNLTFGLSIRYLGMALGYSVALGACMGFGTLLPPLVKGQLGQMLESTAGVVVLVGAVVGLLGVIFCGIAGQRRQNEQNMNNAVAVQNNSISKGLVVAIAAGLLSACFAFGLASGEPIAQTAIRYGAAPLFSNNAPLVVILIGGFFSNALWCVVLLTRNGSWSEITQSSNQGLRNLLLALSGGVIWFAQFFFYGMGSSKLGGQYDFSSWSIHMAFVIVFSSLWGLAFKEWQGVSRATLAWISCGLITLIGSAAIIGWGNMLVEETFPKL